MNSARKFLVATVATLSLVGLGGVANANASSDQVSVSTRGWCC